MSTDDQLTRQALAASLKWKLFLETTPPNTPLKIQGLVQVDYGVRLVSNDPLHRVEWNALAG